MHLATKFHDHVFNRLEVILLSNKPTHKQTDAAENIHLVPLSYASGKQFSLSALAHLGV